MRNAAARKGCLSQSRTLLVLVCTGVLMAGCGADVSRQINAAPDSSTSPPEPNASPSPSATTTSPTPSHSQSPTGATSPSTVPATPAQLGATTQGKGDDCTIPAELEGQDVERLPVEKKRMALTFDAGANGDGLPSIRATLRRKKVRATFFLTGEFVQDHPVKARRLAARDVVGNHTMTHPDLTTLSDQEITQQVRDAEDVIRRRTGEDPRRFLRFPFGARNERTIEVVNELCYVPFRWTVDSLGWKGTSGGQSVTKVVTRVLAAAQPGAIVLMHVGSNPDDGTTLDADALPRIIRKLRRSGYRLVRLASVMAAAP